MDEIGSFVDKSPQNVTQEVVAVFTHGIHDSDTKVRYYAVSSIAVIALQTAPAHLPLKSGAFDLRTYAPLKAALEGVMFDPDTQTRRNTLGAYVRTFKLEPELQQKLMAQVELDYKNRDVIIEALMMDGNFTAPLTELLLRLLDDPEYDHIIAEDIAKTLVVSPPTAFLPKLAEKLSQAQDPARKQGFAGAIGKYGAQARPYLGMIEQMRDRETDVTTIFNLKKAAEAIQTSTPPSTPKPTSTPPASSLPIPPTVPSLSSLASRDPENHAPVVARKSAAWPWVVGILALIVIGALVLKRRA